MPKLIKNGNCQTNDWKILDEEELTNTNITSGNWLIPVNAWISNPSQYSANNLGLWISCDTAPELLTKTMAQVPVIAIVFGAFADGRGFSLARILREDCDFNGELQAAGGFMQDQLYFLQRCGFNAFAINDDADVGSMLESLNDFSNSYQASHDESRPLFRRR